MPSIKLLEIDDSLDRLYKSGLYNLVKSSLDKKYENLCTINHQNDMLPYYYKIANFI